MPDPLRADLTVGYPPSTNRYWHRPPADTRPNAAMYRDFPKALPPPEPAAMTPEQEAEARAAHERGRATLAGLLRQMRGDGGPAG